jgi:tetratricopeptide (TPR) repeat protein
MEINNTLSLEIEEKIEKEFNVIYDLHYYEREYEKVIEQCKYFIETLTKNNCNIKKYYWSAYNILSKANLQLGKTEETIKYAKISNWYAENESVERVDTMDVLGRCYSLTGDKELAKKCFDKCLKIYRNTDFKRGIARILNNKASYIIDYDNAISDMLEAIDIYLELYKKGEIIKDYIIEGAYGNLCEVYIKKGKEGRVYEVLKKMKNKEYIDKVYVLLNELNVKQQKVVGI